jgi:phosphoenolpyruvate carboxykinase (ATP)
MIEIGKKNPNASATEVGLGHVAGIQWNASPAELTEDTLALDEGFLTENGTLAVNTGEFTGRSPKDRFIVKDDITEEAVWWGDINIPFDPEAFDRLHKRVTAYLTNRHIYARDSYVCADPDYRLNVRVYTELPTTCSFVPRMKKFPHSTPTGPSSVRPASKPTLPLTALVSIISPFSISPAKWC